MIIYIGTLVCLTFVFISSIYLRDVYQLLNLDNLNFEFTSIETWKPIDGDQLIWNHIYSHVDRFDSASTY